MAVTLCQHHSAPYTAIAGCAPATHSLVLLILAWNLDWQQSEGWACVDHFHQQVRFGSLAVDCAGINELVEGCCTHCMRRAFVQLQPACSRCWAPAWPRMTCQLTAAAEPDEQKLHDPPQMMRSCHHDASKYGSRAYGHAWVLMLNGTPWLTAMSRVLAEWGHLYGRHTTSCLMSVACALLMCRCSSLCLCSSAAIMAVLSLSQALCACELLTRKRQMPWVESE